MLVEAFKKNIIFLFHLKKNCIQFWLECFHCYIYNKYTVKLHGVLICNWENHLTVRNNPMISIDFCKTGIAYETK